MTARSKFLFVVLLCLSVPVFGQHFPRSPHATARSRQHEASAQRQSPRQMTQALRKASPKRATSVAGKIRRNRAKSLAGTSSAPKIGFLTASTLPVFGYPFFNTLVSGDFNGDSKPDVAIVVETYGMARGTNSDSYSYWISTVLSNGDGTFQPATLTGLADYPAALLAGDLNQDGKADLMTVAYGTCTVWLSDGAGAFTQSQSYSWSGGEWYDAARLADVNADGVLDLVVASTNYDEESSTVVTLLGNSGGTFQDATSVALDNYNELPQLADVNGDGKLDVLGFDSDSGQLQVFLANETGYAPHAVYPTADGSTYYGEIAVGDLNNDGKPEIIATTSWWWSSVSIQSLSNGNCAMLYRNLGDGTFDAGQAQWAGFYAMSTVVADVNADGKPDILSTNSDGADITVMLGNGDGSVTGPQMGYATGGYPRSPALVADFNGDGKLDLIVEDRVMNLVYLQNNGDGTFAAASNYYSALSMDPAAHYGWGISTAVGDFNRDGIPDVVLGKESSSTDLGVSLFLANADGSYRQGISVGDTSEMWYAAVGDYNGDGKLDIFASDGQSEALKVFPGAGDGTFGTPLTIPTDPEGYGSPRSVVTADFDGDGLSDAAAYNFSGTVAVLTKIGSESPVVNTYSLSGEGYMLALGDLNGDGAVDIVAAERWNDTIAVLLGKGDGTFDDPIEIALNQTFSAEPYGLAVGDLTGDGHADIAFTLQGNDSNANDMQYVGVMTGNGDGSFQSPVLFPATARDTWIDAPWPGEIRIADVNHDGRNDLVYTNSDYGTVALRYNQGNGADGNPVFYDPLEFAAGAYPYGIQVADLNLDGALDYVTAGDDFPGITVGLNTSAVRLTTAADKNPALTTDTITLTSQIAPAIKGTRALPSGTVTFSEGTTTLGSATLAGGAAALQLSGLAAGTHTITATYGGDTAFAGGTLDYALVVNEVADYDVTADRTSGTLHAGESLTTTITVNPTGSFHSAVSFSCGTLPKGVTCSFNPASVTPNGSPVSTTLTIKTTGSLLSSLQPSGQSNGILWAGLGSLGTFGMVFFGAIGRRRRTAAVAFTLLAMALLLGLAGCGSSNTTQLQNPNATPAGTHIIHVSSTAAGTTDKLLDITLTVQ